MKKKHTLKIWQLTIHLYGLHSLSSGMHQYEKSALISFFRVAAI